MPGKSYKFNHETLSYEKVKEPFRPKLYRFLKYFFIIIIAGGGLGILYSSFFVTPKMRRLTAEREALLDKYAILNDRIATGAMQADNLRYRNNYVYRTLFGIDTLKIEGIYTPYPDERYAYLDNYAYSDIMGGTWKSLDAMTRQVYLRSKSLDDIQELTLNKEQMALHVPAIWPIDRNNLRGNIGIFNMRRLHPVYKYIRPHRGIDLGANRGDPVYATADGMVKSAKRASGYGQQILVDHGYGYQTRYAHLSKYHVREGQEVKRGELIGEVGNTGVSTGPHLHYEVIYMGRHVDPIMYFRRDMDEEEFRKVIESASDSIFELDD